jgi:predicted phosphoribosyltransferase
MPVADLNRFAKKQQRSGRDSVQILLPCSRALVRELRLSFSEGRTKLNREVSREEAAMFRDRVDAGHQLAMHLKERKSLNPLVLAIPRGGVVIGDILARQLAADLDVVLARKLRCPGQPELAVGALSEDGEIYLNESVAEMLQLAPEDLAEERELQLAEMARRRTLFRSVRPQANVTDRSIIVTDDGIATGSTILAALHWVRMQKPFEVIVAVPVASPDRLEPIREWCDEVVCLLQPPDFWAVGQYYCDFQPVSDEEVVCILKRHASDNAVLHR